MDPDTYMCIAKTLLSIVSNLRLKPLCVMTLITVIKIMVFEIIFVICIFSVKIRDIIISNALILIYVIITLNKMKGFNHQLDIIDCNTNVGDIVTFKSCNSKVVNGKIFYYNALKIFIIMLYLCRDNLQEYVIKNEDYFI